MAGMLGITGGPGTGKKTVAPLVAKKLELPVIDLNELASTYDLVGRGEGGEVDTRALKKRVGRELKGPGLVFGHLLPYVIESGKVEKVVVLRCEPSVLRDRLADRGYSGRKLTENVEAELIGVVSADAFDTFGEAKTSEVDTTRSTPPRAAKAVAGHFKDMKESSRIDWTTLYDSGAKLRSLLGAE